MRRAVAPILAGSFGCAVLVALQRLPPGLAHGGHGRLLGAVLGAPATWLTAGGVAATAIGLVALAGRRRAAGRQPREQCPPDGIAAAIPLGWGAAMPALALVVDPWAAESTAWVLLGAGVGVGTMAAWRRVAPGSSGRRLWGPRPGTRRALAVLAVIAPTLLFLFGNPWGSRLSGDEPHYLLYARSLSVDGDLDLGADYVEGRYRPFFPGELGPHTKPGLEPGSRYSLHGIGTAVWLAPWYALGRSWQAPRPTWLVRSAMALWLGLFAMALYALLDDVAGATAAWRGTALAVLTAPLVFMAPHLFPDVPALALATAAYAVLRRRPGPGGALLAGLLVATLPWLGVKFLALTLTFAVVGAVWLRERRAALAAWLAPLAASGAGHLLFTWLLYGRLSPTAVYFGTGEGGGRAPGLGDSVWAYVADVEGLLASGLGWWLDQRTGLLVYAPHYLLAAAGMAWLWRRRRGDFWALTCLLGAHWGIYALARDPGGWSPPARAAVGALWTLALPAGIALALRVPAGAGRRLWSAVRGALVAAGAGITALLVVQPELLYHDYGIRRSLLLLRYGAPGPGQAAGLPLWRAFPGLMGLGDPQWAVSLTWLVLTVAAAALLWRLGRIAGLQAEPDVAPGAEVGGGWSPGLSSAMGLWLAGGGLLLLHHLLVPVSALGQPRHYGAVAVWASEVHPRDAWPEADGIWIRGDDPVRLPLSAPEEVAAVRLEVSALVSGRVRLQLGGDAATADVVPNRPVVVRLQPREGSATPWFGARFYQLGVVFPGGVSPAQLGTDPRDLRHLGAYVRILRVETRRPGTG